jgi:hypothetical protein
VVVEEEEGKTIEEEKRRKVNKCVNLAGLLS